MKMNHCCTYDHNTMKAGITISAHQTDRSQPVSLDLTRGVFERFKPAYLQAMRTIWESSDYLPEYAPLPTLTVHITGHRRAGMTTVFRYDGDQNAVILRWYDFDTVAAGMVVSSERWEL